MTRLSTPAARSTDGLAVRRHQRVSLQIATLLSLLLHALLAGGLATTSLGILPTPSPDNPSGMKNIFKPKLAADFPLEVPKSGGDAPAHEKPLALEIPVAKAAANSRKPASAKTLRTVSPAKAAEAAEQAQPAAELPQRSSRQRDKTLAAATQLERRAADAQPTGTAEQKPQAERLAVKPAEATAATAPRPARSQDKPPRTSTGDRVTKSSTAREPREVAIMERARPQTAGPGRTTTPRREPSQPASAPQVTNLSRRQTAVEAGSAPTAPAETITAPPPTQAADAQAQP
ncbi:MAG: hypothetical protein WCJ18_04005, partial [Planctomycetota bacterium]